MEEEVQKQQPKQFDSIQDQLVNPGIEGVSLPPPNIDLAASQSWLSPGLEQNVSASAPVTSFQPPIQREKATDDENTLSDEELASLNEAIVSLEASQVSIISLQGQAQNNFTTSRKTLTQIETVMGQLKKNFDEAHKQHLKIVESARQYALAWQAALSGLALFTGGPIGLPGLFGASSAISTLIGHIPKLMGMAVPPAPSKGAEFSPQKAFTDAGVVEFMGAAGNVGQSLFKVAKEVIELGAQSQLIGAAQTAMTTRYIEMNQTVRKGEKSAKATENAGIAKKIKSGNLNGKIASAQKALAKTNALASSLSAFQQQLQTSLASHDQTEMEKQIWIQWMASTDTVRGTDRRGVVHEHQEIKDFDNDIIENYLRDTMGLIGKNSRLGVDFGDWTSDEDELDAHIAAKAAYLKGQHGSVSGENTITVQGKTYSAGTRGWKKGTAIKVVNVGYKLSYATDLFEEPGIKNIEVEKVGK